MIVLIAIATLFVFAVAPAAYAEDYTEAYAELVSYDSDNRQVFATMPYLGDSPNDYKGFIVALELTDGSFMSAFLPGNIEVKHTVAPFDAILVNNSLGEMYYSKNDTGMPFEYEPTSMQTPLGWLTEDITGILIVSIRGEDGTANVTYDTYVEESGLVTKITAGPFAVEVFKPTVGISNVVLTADTSAPYYPGASVSLSATVNGTGITPGTPESSVYWYLYGNTSEDTYIDGDPYGEATLYIGSDEIASVLEVEAISTYDSTKSASVSVPVTYPLNLQIAPAQTTLITSAKAQEIQFELLLPNGQPFDYSLLEWTTPGADGQYFRIDDNGLLEILPGAPAGSVTVKYAYQHDTGNVSTTSAIVTITTQQEGIYDQLTPTPEQSDKADQMEDAIGDAADKLENNNSSLGQLTPTRPQINTDLQLDPEKLIAVSPLVTNIWSISGLQSLIGIVVLVATVAYIFFGKRDG